MAKTFFPFIRCPLGFTLVALALGVAAPVHADLILSGSPSARDQAEIANRYTVLAEQLTQALDEPVRYVQPANSMNYAQEMRKGTYDILIDGPHFGAWRIAKGLHKPVVNSSTPLTFLVVVPSSDKTTQTIEQLIGKPVCMQRSPTLSNLMFMNLYANPIQLPVPHITPGYDNAVDTLQSGKCEAAVLGAQYFDKALSKEQQAKFRVLYNTPPLPGNNLTMSNKVSDEKRKALIKRVTSADPANDKLVQAMTNASVGGGDPSKTRWETTNPESLKGLDKLLARHSYGWE